jgi:hypothetical protein
MSALAKKLADMAELEQIRAMAIDDKADGMKAGQQAIKLGERDRHVARSGAFLEAARLAMEEAA